MTSGSGFPVDAEPVRPCTQRNFDPLRTDSLDSSLQYASCILSFFLYCHLDYSSYSATKAR